jgi:hypothetical protein
MQVSEGLGVVEPLGFRHNTFDQRKDARRTVGEAFDDGVPVGGCLGAAFVKPTFGAGGVVGRRQPQQSQEIAALVMGALFLELGAAFRIDQARDGIWKGIVGIMVGGLALGLHENGPTRTQAAECIVEPASDGDQLDGRGGIEIRPAKARASLQRAVLVEHDAFADQRRPG